MFYSVMDFFDRNRNVVVTFLLGILSCVYLVLCTMNIYLAIGLVAACTAVFLFLKDIDLCFVSYLVLMPFGYSHFAYRLPNGVTAVKLELILLLGCMAVFLFHKKLTHFSKALYFMLGAVLAVYGIAWARSTGYALTVFSGSFAGELPLYRYLLDYVSWTVIALAPLFIVAWYYNDNKGIDKIVKTIALSMLMLSGYMILVYLFKINDKSNFEVIRSELAAYSGLHGNDLANYCILSFPIVMAWALRKKSVMSFITLAAIVFATIISFSRTAYFLVLFGLFLFLISSRKLKWAPAAVIAIAVILNFAVPDIVIERAVSGWDTGSYEQISAGRIDLIWQPLVEEIKSKPEMLLWGSGRYGIANTDAWNQGSVLRVFHAHNMYLDCILDTGVFGLAVLLAFFIGILIWFGKSVIRLRKDHPYQADLLAGCMISIICYMISGLSGRSFFPSVSNLYLWVAIGLGIALSKASLAKVGEDVFYEKSGVHHG